MHSGLFLVNVGGIGRTYHTGREYCGIHVQLGYVFAGILKRLRFVACDLAILLGVLS